MWKQEKRIQSMNTGSIKKVLSEGSYKSELRGEIWKHNEHQFLNLFHVHCEKGYLIKIEISLSLKVFRIDSECFYIFLNKNIYMF